jgi:hypothetical protein
MDQATQQNAALVEQMAAAAGSLSGQARELVEAVAVFRIAQGGAIPAAAARAPAVGRPTAPPPAPKPAPAKVSAARPAARAPSLTPPAQPKPAAAKPAKAGGDDDWESF